MEEWTKNVTNDANFVNSSDSVNFPETTGMPPGTNDIKKLVILAIASDDELMEQLVLKGGHAIELVQRRGNRMSRISNDFDFSMEGSFDDDLVGVKTRL